MDLGRQEEAEACYRSALSIKPEYAEAHGNLGVALKELGRREEAEASCRRAVEINPDYAEAYNNLGNLHKDLGNLEEAEKHYHRALAIKPEYAEAYSNLLFTLNYGVGHKQPDRIEEARRYGQMVAAKVNQRFTCWRCEPQPVRLRVGMVSGDLRNHPVGYFLESVLEHIDLSRIELTAFPTDSREDERTARIKACFSGWKPLVGMSDEAAAKLIHADGIHLLLDLSGHTAHNRLPVFAWKPAPRQASWLGYFATTGVAEMDYLLADVVGVPLHQRLHFTETVWYLPDTRLCFSVPEIDVAVNELPALKCGHITFGSFQNLTKVGDGVLLVWGKILTLLPTARLRLQCRQLGDSRVVTDLINRLRQCGINPERVEFHGGMARKAYLAAHGEVDLLLDTFPYPGGTTTCEALWMGVPTVTLAGDCLLSRQGAGLLAAGGLPEWIAVTEDDYVAKAVLLTRNLPELSALRTRLRSQVLASPLFDAPRFAHNFVTALWGMWEQWQNNTNR
jgi:predicted O-linked N-acetylglucosamine transferase (SPINDLY family)